MGKCFQWPVTYNKTVPEGLLIADKIAGLNVARAGTKHPSNGRLGGAMRRYDRGGFGTAPFARLWGGKSISAQTHPVVRSQRQRHTTDLTPLIYPSWVPSGTQCGDGKRVGVRQRRSPGTRATPSRASKGDRGRKRAPPSAWESRFVARRVGLQCAEMLRSGQK